MSRIIGFVAGLLLVVLLVIVWLPIPNETKLTRRKEILCLLELVEKARKLGT